jgi:hypothetical protein
MSEVNNPTENLMLADLSGIAYHVLINYYLDGGKPPIEDVRNALFRDLENYVKLHGETFGRLVVCVDSKPYWRTSIQAAYKLNRLKARSGSTTNIEAFYADLKSLVADIVEYTDYICLEVATAEADDTIAVLCQHITSQGGKILIISSDKDMIQLQARHADVYQFSPNRNKLLTLDNTEYDLLPHILKGDVGDGIPNVFSVEGFYMIEGDKPRQQAITKKIVAEVREYFPDTLHLCPLLSKADLVRFRQNRQLIDTSYTPETLVHDIKWAYIRAKDVHQEHRVEELLSPFEAEEEVCPSLANSVRM